MANIDSLIQALDERTIFRRIGKPIDDARVRYRLDSSTVEGWSEFQYGIGDFYAYLDRLCISVGGRLDPGDARSRAKEILEREYRRKGKDIVAAYVDSIEGNNGGFAQVLSIIAEGLKAAAVERYVREQFDSHIPPHNFEKKVDYIRQLFARLEPYLSTSVQLDRPERYASDYRAVIEAYVEGLRQSSSVFRRL